MFTVRLDNKDDIALKKIRLQLMKKYREFVEAYQFTNNQSDQLKMYILNYISFHINYES